MKTINDEKEFFNQLMTMLSMQLGPSCEIVLHDLTKDYEHTIVDIRNNGVTGRKIGDCGSNLGLEVLKGTAGAGDRYNYVTLTKDHKILRSSSMYIKSDEGKVVGALCINWDITETIRLQSFLSQFNNYDVQKSANVEGNADEYFADNVQDLLDYLISTGQRMIKKPVSIMNKKEKIQFIKWLDDKGAFLISKSSERIIELMGISKFTFYKYLEMAHKQDAENQDLYAEKIEEGNGFHGQ